MLYSAFSVTICSAGQMDADALAALFVHRVDSGDLLAQAQRHPVLPQVVDQRVHDLGVDEGQ